MRKSDAQGILIELQDVNIKLKDKEIYPTKVKLIPAIQGIAAGAGKPGTADGFVVHSPNEVYEYLNHNN